MRDQFRGYYQPTSEEVEAIWDKGTTVLDANVLLSLYKVSPATSNFYLAPLEQRAAKNWLPYQVAMEFHNNVHKIRSEQTAGHSKRITEVQKFRDALRNTESKSRLQKSEIQAQIEEYLGKFISELEEEQTSIKDQTHHHKPDDLLGRISELFADRVGPKPTAEELVRLHALGKTRFDSETPLGYEDRKTKSGGDEYGDYIFWKQVMDYAKSTETDIVLVTDDNKADWWLKIEGNSVAPRPELIQEFREVTGQNIIIWPSGKFYSHLTKPAKHAGKSAEAQAAADDMQEAVSRTQTRSEGESALRILLNMASDSESTIIEREQALSKLDERTRRRFDKLQEHFASGEKRFISDESNHGFTDRAELVKRRNDYESASSLLGEGLHRVGKKIDTTDDPIRRLQLKDEQLRIAEEIIGRREEITKLEEQIRSFDDLI